MFKYKLSWLIHVKRSSCWACLPVFAVPVAARQLSHGVASLLLLHKWGTPLRPACILADKKLGGAKEKNKVLGEWTVLERSPLCVCVWRALEQLLPACSPYRNIAFLSQNRRAGVQAKSRALKCRAACLAKKKKGRGRMRGASYRYFKGVISWRSEGRFTEIPIH